ILSMASPLFSRMPSASSVHSDDSLVSADVGTLLGPADAIVEGPRRTRKRFTSQQLMMLEHLYHQASHPTREQREQLAKDAEIDVRSVTVWFQNKRQTDRRIHRQLSEPASMPVHLQPSSSPAYLSPSSPFSNASGKTIHTVRARTLSSTSVASSASAASLCLTGSRKRERKHEHASDRRHVRHKPSRHLSLDDVAARTERPMIIPRTPPQCPASSSSPERSRTPEAPSEDDSCAGTKALWENMQSSPPAPDPAPRSERDLVRYGRRKYTLEYACAREIVGGKARGKPGKERRKTGSGLAKRGSDNSECTGLGSPLLPVGKSKGLASDDRGPKGGEEDDQEIPMLEWDIDMHADTDTDGIPSEAVTPSSSFGIGELSVANDHEKENLSIAAERPAGGLVPEATNQEARDEEDLMDVAYVLCGLSQGC
ncbi:hypothetical protein BD414DRAFT_419864, partial [Trametes punicea]